ncbi:MAG: YlmC/YmxH family sporulation protein [Clostridia bacterium]|nr:YlmC/YmxH family sporulation protein [Clostridia bacterium]
MLWRLTELKSKEVINLKNGAKLGTVSDIEIDIANGSIKSIVVPSGNGAFSLFGKHEDIIIPFEDIKKAGNDLLLVDYEPSDIEAAKNGKRNFFGFLV